MFSIYRPQDVTILLKDVSGLVKPIEYEPSEKYLQAYFDALKRYAKITAAVVANVAEKIFANNFTKVIKNV